MLPTDLPPRLEITGHLHNSAALKDPSIKEYEVALDPLNAYPTNPEVDRPHFFPLPVTDKIAKIEKEDVERATMFLPTHRTISRAISPLLACMGRTCSVACWCSFTCGCRLANGFTRAILNTWLIGSK